MRRGIASCWADLLRTLQHESVCYQIEGMADDADDGYRPRDTRTGINYGLEVMRAVTELQKTRLTRDQIDAIEHLVAWVAKAARC